jgi:ABC-type antimicrobial peptide transport system permease subunit
MCAGVDALPRIRKEIAAILPGTQVVERGSRVLARFEARTKVQQEAKIAIDKEKMGRQNLRNIRERLASILTPVIVTACAVWIALLGFTNVRARREEIGVLRTLGVSAKGILAMFLSRHILVGVLGGALGFCAGVLAAVYFGAALEDTRIGITDMDLSVISLLVLSVGGAAVLALIAGWIPTLTAIRQDPAEVLREE